MSNGTSRSIGAVSFHNVTRREALGQLLGRLSAPVPALPFWVVTPNALIAGRCEEDPALCRAVADADLRVADGYGVLMAARLMGTPLRERIAGIELGEDLLAACAARHHSVYFLGGRPGVATEAAARWRQKLPALRVAGTCDGYFREEESDAVLADIRAAAPDVLFVCMGCPRQELWTEKHRHRLGPVKVCLTLGGSLDVWAGRVTRAPRLLSEHGWEWLWRMIRQPARLAALPTMARFLLSAIKSRVRGRS